MHSRILYSACMHAEEKRVTILDPPSFVLISRSGVTFPWLAGERLYFFPSPWAQLTDAALVCPLCGWRRSRAPLIHKGCLPAVVRAPMPVLKSFLILLSQGDERRGYGSRQNRHMW